MAVVIDTEGAVQIAPGRGDLRFGSERAPSPDAYPSLYGLHDSAWLLNSTGQQVPISYAKLFAEQPYVFTAVMRMLWWAVKVPLKTYRRVPDGKERLYPGDHPIASALQRPWDRASTYNLVSNFLGPLLVHGNATVRVDRGTRSGRLEFQPKDWRYMTPIQAWRNSISGWRSVEDDDSGETFPVQEVIHATWWSPLGPTGISPLASLGVTLQTEDAARKFARDTLNAGGTPPSVITVSEDFLGFDDEERRAAMAMVREQATNQLKNRPGEPAIIPAGLDWKPMARTAVEAELIKQRQVNREEIAAVYMMPPPFLGDLTHATYSNIEALKESAYTDTLGPPLILIETVLNSQLVQGLMGEDSIFVEFDFSHVLRGNRLEEIKALREAIAGGLMSPNEGRSALNLAASDEPGAKALWLPTNNLSPLDQAGKDDAEEAPE